MSFCVPGITHCSKHNKPIDLIKGCDDCEKEKKKMINKELDLDEIAKTMSNVLKKLTEALGNFNEEKIKEILTKSIKPTLSEAERAILENINKDYKWIARDRDEKLYIYTVKPSRSTLFNNWNLIEGKAGSMSIFNHLFQFITWQDDEPYNIEELLKGE